MNVRTGRFPLFDSLRAIAALAVVMHHAAILSHPDALPATLRHVVIRFDVGVTIFFLISGFLLYRPFARAHIEGERAPDALGYGWRRFLRIAPAYWVALIVIALALGADGMGGSVGALTSFGFARAYDHPLAWMPQAWSLTVEVAFYALLPLYALGARRLSRGRGGRSAVRVEIAALVVLVVVSVAYKAWVVRSGHYQTLDAAHRALPAYLDQFALGMGLAVASVWLGRRERADGMLERLAPAGWLLAVLALWLVSTRFGFAGRPSTQLSPGQYWGAHYLYAAVAIGLLLPAAFGDEARGLVRRLLGLRPLMYIGLVSYGVYLYHFAAMAKLREWGVAAPSDLVGFAAWVLLAAAAATLLATVSYYALERRALSLKGLVGRDARRPQVEALTEPAPAAPPAAEHPR